MHNGVPANELTGVTWRKSSFSAAGNCVEFAKLGRHGAVAVRNSRFPEGPALVYTRSEIDALIRGKKTGVWGASPAWGAPGSPGGGPVPLPPALRRVPRPQLVTRAGPLRAG